MAIMKRLFAATLMLGSAMAKAGVITGMVIGSMLSHDNNSPQQSIPITVTDNKSLICLYNIELDSCSSVGPDHRWMSIMQLIGRQEGKAVRVQILSKTYMRGANLANAYIYVIVEYKVLQ